jgi:hypothetical protein
LCAEPLNGEEVAMGEVKCFDFGSSTGH